MTPLKIVGLNNYRRLQGDKLAQVAQFSLGGRGNKDAAALPSLMLMLIVMLGGKSDLHPWGGWTE